MSPMTALLIILSVGWATAMYITTYDDAPVTPGVGCVETRHR